VSHLEYIRSCEELWQKGMYLELQAYQHHVFMDWRFVDDEKWSEVNAALQGAGVESMQKKWDEMFGEKKEDEAEEVKTKKPRRKTAVKKTGETKPKAPRKKKSESSRESTTSKKPAAKKVPVKKKTNKK
jgi:hypothetical protein